MKITFAFRALNFLHVLQGTSFCWKGLVIRQIKTMLLPHYNVSNLEPSILGANIIDECSLLTDLFLIHRFGQILFTPMTPELHPCHTSQMESFTATRAVAEEAQLREAGKIVWPLPTGVLLTFLTKMVVCHIYCKCLRIQNLKLKGEKTLPFGVLPSNQRT